MWLFAWKCVHTHKKSIFLSIRSRRIIHARVVNQFIVRLLLKRRIITILYCKRKLHSRFKFHFSIHFTGFQAKGFSLNICFGTLTFHHQTGGARSVIEIFRTELQILMMTLQLIMNLIVIMIIISIMVK